MAKFCNLAQAANGQLPLGKRLTSGTSIRDYALRSFATMGTKPRKARAPATLKSTGVRDLPPDIVAPKSQPLAGGGELASEDQSNPDCDHVKEKVKNRCPEGIDRPADARQHRICACAHLRRPTSNAQPRAGESIHPKPG